MVHVASRPILPSDYLVPELAPGQRFDLDASHWIGELREAAALGIATRAVVLGPFSFLKLSKGLELPHTALDELVPVYAELLAALSGAGATAVQVDEPCLVLDLAGDERDAFEAAWRVLAGGSDLDLCLTTYFAGLDAVGRSSARWGCRRPSFTSTWYGRPASSMSRWRR